MKLQNYLDLMIDEKIDNITRGPICINGVSKIIEKIYLDLKINISKGNFQKTLIINGFNCTTFFSWKNNKYPIPIIKVKKLINFWKDICNKTDKECKETYDQFYRKAKYFRMFRSPLKIKVIKELDEDLSYLIGILFSDGCLRNIWKTYRNKGRFRFEISITDEFSDNLEISINLLNKLFT